MKKIFLTLILSFILSVNVNANNEDLNKFVEWLADNNHTQYIEVNKNYEECKNCTTWDAGPRCFEEVGKPKKQCVLDGDQSYGEDGFKWADHKKYKTNLNIKPYKESEIPWGTKPNKDTILYYLYTYLDEGYSRAGSKGTNNPYKFETQLRDDKISKYIKKQMQKTALLSYLLYEDGKITIDEISPKDRFGILYDNNTQFTSMSVGKSLVSYVTGHAICKGYIDSVETKLNDWPLLKNTLFYDQELINLLNMAAGHHKYADKDLKTKLYRKNANVNTVRYHLKEGVFKNSKKSKNKYQYTNFITNILINYVWFKSEGKFQDLLDEIFVEKVKIENDVWFLKHNNDTIRAKNTIEKKDYDVFDEDGLLRYSFRASRYDYLRIAKAMLDDWQNDTCVGKYLKNIYDRRIPTNSKWKDDKSPGLNPKSYAGQFYADYSGMRGRNIMGMVGKGNQSIMIDFDKGRIVVINTMHSDYNWKRISHSVIKNGS